MAARAAAEWAPLPLDMTPVELPARLDLLPPLDLLPSLDVLPSPRPAGDDRDVQPMADVLRVGGLSRPVARHAAADTATFPRQVA